MQRPAFVTFTGVDRVDIIPGLQALSRLYPIEWGVLLRPGGAPDTLFPDPAVVAALQAAGGLRLAAHLCGPAAVEVVETLGGQGFDPTGFQRVQVNHGFSGSTPGQAVRARDYGRRWGVRPILQTPGDFPEGDGVDWLYDVSFGTGRRPDRWPGLPEGGGFYGFSGGLGPDTIGRALAEIAAPEGALYWLDMEFAVRSEGWLDLAKCRKVCEQVFG